MKSIFSSVLSVLFIGIMLISCSQAVKDPHYKNGTFRIDDHFNNSQYLIVRNDSIQHEYNLTTGDSASYSVQWLNDSVYTLEMVSGQLEILEFFQGKVLTVHIEEIYDDSVIVQSSFEGEQNPHRVTLIKEKE